MFIDCPKSWQSQKYKKVTWQTLNNNRRVMHRHNVIHYIYGIHFAPGVCIWSDDQETNLSKTVIYEKYETKAYRIVLHCIEFNELYMYCMFIDYIRRYKIIHYNINYNKGANELYYTGNRNWLILVIHF